MLIQYCSDLHLEFRENKCYLDAHPVKPMGDILILAGDIVPFVIMDKYGGFFDSVSRDFEAVYWLPGNHEYYHSDILERSGSFKEAIRSNVFLLNNEVALHGDVTLIFSTLWTSISPAAEWNIARGMADYKVIKQAGGRFRPLHSNRMHRECKKFLEESVMAARGKVVVATHHVPTFMHYPAEYRSSVLNEAFAVELFPFIEPSGIDYWIYGHHHTNTPEFEIGRTKLRTNQLGYVGLNEHREYKEAAIIDV